ncbi:hypothetical protein [Lysinibacillus sp. NPDC093692]|uniref:hypothetical protein n=1 Tax=Lysinibacillus sp. NPDC093692 TaxID=3390578 RepID=UPI003CFBC71E
MEKDKLVEALKEIAEIANSLKEFNPTYQKIYDITQRAFDKQKALEIINSIEIEEVDSDGETMLYANVEDNEENREKIRSLGYSDDEIDNFKPYEDEPIIDLGLFVWDYANWFDGEKFIIKEDLDD